MLESEPTLVIHGDRYSSAVGGVPGLVRGKALECVGTVRHLRGVPAVEIPLKVVGVADPSSPDLVNVRLVSTNLTELTFTLSDALASNLKAAPFTEARALAGLSTEVFGGVLSTPTTTSPE